MQTFFIDCRTSPVTIRQGAGGDLCGSGFAFDLLPDGHFVDRNQTEGRTTEVTE